MSDNQQPWAVLNFFLRSHRTSTDMPRSCSALWVVESVGLSLTTRSTRH